MGIPSRVEGDVYVNGSFSCSAFSPPAASIGDAAIAANAKLAASKLQASFAPFTGQTGAVVADTKYLHVCRGLTGTVISLRGAITEVVATGADRTVTVDLQKSTAAGAFATVLAAALVFNNVSTLRQWVGATVSVPGLVAGDILRVTVAVAGAAGAQAQGLVVEADVWEDAN